MRVVDTPPAMAAPAAMRAAGHDQRLVLVDPKPHPRGAALHHAHGRRPDELSGDEGPELPRHRPADRHRHGLAAGRLARAARDRRRPQAREPDRDAAGRQAHLHHGAGRPARRTTVEFRLEKPTQEAVDDVRDAVSRVRSDLPADLRDPVISKLRPRRLADPHLHGGVEPDGRRGAFLVRRRHRHAHAARGARRRRGDAGRRRDARGPRRARPGAPARAARHGGRHLAPAAPEPARELGRAHRRRRRRAVGAHDRHRADGGRAGADGDQPERRPAHPPRPGRARPRHRGREALGGLSRRQAGRRLRDRAHARRRRGRGRRRRAGGARDAQEERSRASRSPRPSTSSSRSSRTTKAR